LRAMQPDAARGAGDHRYLAVQPSHVVTPVKFVHSNIPAPRGQGKRACSIATTRRSAGFAALVATKSPIFGVIGHILDALIT
ncbi:hypothetical protein, partial [Bradyrhizobium sp. sGM-13]|uniref:hypothetical protein n=1 Tax=Bradyrhizobium sp. sGM-13 TaxID=2831781 RepID=UPI001BCD9298